MIQISVDNRILEVANKTSLLEACLENKIYIPHLCYLKGMTDVPASCRLCFVEVVGQKQPLSACTTQVKKDMVVKTNTQVVRRLQRTALELLLSTHHVECGRCPANKKCELQRLARFLKVGLKPKRLALKLKKEVLDEGHPCMDYYPNRCVLCGRCIYVCEKKHGRARMAMAHRGLKTVISFYGQKAQLERDCSACNDCIAVCPVGALIAKDHPKTI